jgi:ankyrin repeat protein
LAAMQGHTECMQLLLDAYDPAAQVMAVDKYGMNALMSAADSGESECVRYLLGQPCAREQVEAVDKYGMNALMSACHRGHAACVNLLLSACGGSLTAAQCQATTK